MTYRVAIQAALMRCQNTDRRRKALWMHLRRRVTMGQLTPKEADQLRAEFWEDRRRDVEFIRGNHR